MRRSKLSIKYVEILSCIASSSVPLCLTSMSPILQVCIIINFINFIPCIFR